MSYEFNQASHPVNHAKDSILDLSAIAEKITHDLASACGGMSQISNLVIAHAAAGQCRNSNILHSNHAEIIIKKIQERIAEFFGEWQPNNNEDLGYIDSKAEAERTIKMFKSIYDDKASDDFKMNCTKDYILI